MIIKVKDHRVLATEIQAFFWREHTDEDGEPYGVLKIILKGQTQGCLNIEGSKTLLGQMEKSYLEAMRPIFNPKVELK